ncbi:hypothetical protein PMAYCL1PPCAC_18296 [Pristionchus mayeri]|uniref:Uncharacterized protein n=1 Tax=Pristionchus mayeri TaxID=1317129 RepID=A0AAN5CP83_9BILA|nr:hypothetical protein PMAYCL1PPCAC_18296 [Pristionchus mayeri]
MFNDIRETTVHFANIRTNPGQMFADFEDEIRNAPRQKWSVAENVVWNLVCGNRSGNDSLYNCDANGLCL